jgi:hypothetical protein
MNCKGDFMKFGGQVYSIRDSGTLLFNKPLTATVGGLLVDLLSAPIPAGQYQLNIDVKAGGVEIFLPRYAQFVVNGGAGFGGQSVHRGHEAWEKLTKKLSDPTLPVNTPEDATREPNPEQAVLIQLNVHTGIGGIDIYQA